MEGETEEVINDSFAICPEPNCFSPIQILSINEDNASIKYKCLKDNQIYTKPIKEYLGRIKECKLINMKGFRYKCDEHEIDNNYVSYCFDCKKHLCTECLKTRKHIDHQKRIIMEIKPIEKELEIIDEVVGDYKNEIKILEKEQNKKEEDLKNALGKEKAQKEKDFQDKKESNQERMKEDIKNNYNQFLSDIDSDS